MTYTAKKKITIIGIVFLLLVTLLAVFFAIKLINDKSQDDTIYFFIGDEVVSSEKVTNIDEAYLESLKDNVEKKEGYDYEWSLSKDEYKEIDLNNITTKTEVFLIEKLHKYDVKINTPENVGYTVISGNEQTINQEFIFEVNTNPGYNQVVIINGQEVKPNEDNKYSTIIKGDLEIDIIQKEIITIIPLDNTYTYDGTNKPFNFKLSNNKEITDDFIIKYYDTDEYTNEVIPVNSHDYYVLITYIGNDYDFDEYRGMYTIQKGKLDVIWPKIGKGVSGNPLASVTITPSINNYGKFTWSDTEEYLDDQIDKYKLIFTPNDLDNYEILEKTVSVEMMTDIEQLEIVNGEIEHLLDTLPKVIRMDDYLPINGINPYTNIYWYSQDTILSINSDGYVTILENIENYNVTLIGIVNYANAAEYITLDYVLNQKTTEPLEVESHTEESVVVYKMRSLEKRIDTYYLPNNYEITSIVITCNSDLEESHIPVILHKYLNCYEYKLISSFTKTVSEVIVWKVISSKDKGGSDTTSNYLFRLT